MPLQSLITSFFRKADDSQKTTPCDPNFDINCYPESVWHLIFLRCDKETLSSVVKCCRYFNEIVSARFWIEKCELDGVTLPPIEWRKFVRNDETEPGSSADQSIRFDYKKIYFRNPFNRNICYKLTRESTLEGLEAVQHLRFHHGGNGIRIDSDVDPAFAPENEQVEACFVTSYGWCHRYYEINLEEAGIDPWIMDHIRPTITIRELNCCRRDCAAVYRFQSQLLLNNELFDRHVVLPRFKFYEKHWEQWTGGQEWETVEHVYTDYPIGIRKIGLFSGGKDEQFWAGFYGARFTNTEVIISFPEDIRYKADGEFADPPKEFAGAVRQPLRSLRIPGLRGRLRGQRGG